MTRVLVTGCNGTIGRSLVRELRSRGYDIYGCDLQHSADPKVIRADVGNMRQLRRVFENVLPDYVYHLAAEFGRNNGEEYYEQLWQSNVIGTRNVMECCNQIDAQLFFASSSEVYGEEVPLHDSGNVLPLHEDLTDKTPNHSNEYAISKWTNELQIRNFNNRNGTDFKIMRFFNAYGPGEFYHPYRSVVALFVYRALNGIRFDVYEGYRRTFMHIRDFIPTLANMCSSKLNHDVYNIGGVDYRSVQNLAEIVLDATDADWSLVNLKPFESHNVLSKIPDISRAQQDLNHNPSIVIEEGVPETVSWMKSVELSHYESV